MRVGVFNVCACECVRAKRDVSILEQMSKFVLITCYDLLGLPNVERAFLTVAPCQALAGFDLPSPLLRTGV